MLGSKPTIKSRIIKLSNRQVFNLDEDAPLEEWQSAVSKVIESGSQSGALWLKHLTKNDRDKDRQLKVTQMLTDKAIIEGLDK